MTLTGSFHGVNGTVDVAVVDEAVAINSVAIHDNLESLSTLRGVIDENHTVTVTVSFSDGTVIKVADSGQHSSSWLEPSMLLNYSADLN